MAAEFALTQRTEHDLICAAVLSDDRVFRYSLTRIWDRELPCICFIGLNPSTADEHNNDPTIRKEMSYARRWHTGGLLKLNAFNFRATHPRDLFVAADRIGTDGHMSGMIERIHEYGCTSIVCAWGNSGNAGQKRILAHRAQHIVDSLISAGLTLSCLKRNGDGSPAHPLYLSLNLPLLPYSRAASVK